MYRIYPKNIVTSQVCDGATQLAFLIRYTHRTGARTHQSMVEYVCNHAERHTRDITRIGGDQETHISTPLKYQQSFNLFTLILDLLSKYM